MGGVMEACALFTLRGDVACPGDVHGDWTGSTRARELLAILSDLEK